MSQPDSNTMRPVSTVRWAAHLVMAVSVSLILMLAGCSSDQTADKKTEIDNQSPAAIQRDTSSTAARQDTRIIDIKYTPPNVPFDLNGTPVDVAGARFVPATQWEDLGPYGEMVAHYRYGPLEEETDQADVMVFYFGEGGHDWERVVDRWISQISLSGGRDARSSARRHDRQVGGMTAHVLSMDGIYTPPSEGFDKAIGTRREHYRLVGVVIQAPGGNIYFKLTGPEYTGRIMIDQFMNMIYRVKKA